MISGRYSRISSTSDVPFDEDLEFEIEGNSSKQQRGSGPYYEFYCVKSAQNAPSGKKKQRDIAQKGSSTQAY